MINAEVKRWVFYSRDVITSITVENSKKHEQRPLCRHVVGFCQCFFFLHEPNCRVSGKSSFYCRRRRSQSEYKVEHFQSLCKSCFMKCQCAL